MNKEDKKTRHGFWFGIFSGAALGALLVGAIAAAGPALAFRAFEHRAGGHRVGDPAAIAERAEFAADFVLSRVDATEAQQVEVKRILSDTIADVTPLAEQHRANRDALHTELAREVIDPAAIEQLRQSEMALADQASRELTEALTGFAQILTVDQRNQLMEMGRRFHR